MLERFFGSSTRVKVIKFYCTNPSARLYLRELARTLDIEVSALTRELTNLEHVGFLKISSDRGKKYYEIDSDFPLLHELKSLIVKSIILLERALVRDLKTLQGLQLFMLTGIFNNQDTGTDILLVGSVNRSRVQKLIKDLSRSFYQDIRFSVLLVSEYRYRIEVSDKFIYKILNLSPIVIINKLQRLMHHKDSAAM